MEPNEKEIFDTGDALESADPNVEDPQASPASNVEDVHIKTAKDVISP